MLRDKNYASLVVQICPGLNPYEIQTPYDKHHKVSSLVKSQQNTPHNSVKYEVALMKMQNNPAI